MDTSPVVLAKYHLYQITATPNGPKGTYAVVTDPSPSGGIPPVASFTIQYFGYMVQVDATSSYDPDGMIVSYLWDWGDGTTGTEVFNGHEYVPGSYTITLTVMDNDDLFGTVSQNIAWGGPPYPPEANFWISMRPTGLDWDTASCDGTPSFSPIPDGVIVAYGWDFGDGSTATGIKVNHTYSGLGMYKVTLTVTDNYGLQNSRWGWIQVAPQVTPAFYAQVYGNTVTVDVTGLDPDGRIVSYAWSWGDGEIGSGITATHKYRYSGMYSITLVTTDINGANLRITQLVTI
jgi:PKD repeat protein